jgi:type II secretory pathway component PulJ
MIKIKSENGYSLIEVIIAIQLFLIVITLLYSIFSFNQKFITNWIKSTDKYQDKIARLDFLEKELRQSKRLTGFSSAEISYLNKDYLNSTISWSEDTVYAGSDINIKMIPLQIKEVRIFGYSQQENVIRQFLLSETNENGENSEADKSIKKETYEDIVMIRIYTKLDSIIVFLPFY